MTSLRAEPSLVGLALVTTTSLAYGPDGSDRPVWMVTAPAGSVGGRRLRLERRRLALEGAEVDVDRTGVAVGRCACLGLGPCRRLRVRLAQVDHPRADRADQPLAPPGSDDG